MGDEYDPKNEIAEMNEWEPTSKAPTTDPPVDPSTDPPATEAPGTDAPSTESPSTEAPGTKAPTTEAPDELQLARDELERTLREKVEKESIVTKAPSTKAPSTDPPDDPEADLDFIGDDDLDEITSSKNGLNTLLNRVYKAGVGAGTKLGSEKVLRSIPEIVQKNIKAQSSIQAARETFFKNNEDLQPYTQVVAESFNKAVGEHPDFTMEKLLQETEKEARRRLNLHRKMMIEDTKSAKKKPAFEKTPSGKKAQKAGKLDGLAKELDDMQNLT